MWLSLFTDLFIHFFSLWFSSSLKAKRIWAVNIVPLLILGRSISSNVTRCIVCTLLNLCCVALPVFLFCSSACVKMFYPKCLIPLVGLIAEKPRKGVKCPCAFPDLSMCKLLWLWPISVQSLMDVWEEMPCTVV